VPAAEWQKILVVLTTPDDTSTTTDDHDVLNSLVTMDLMDRLGSLGVLTYDAPISLTIGNQTWIYEPVID
jgi:hypothetical protein